ncbi:MAG: hypothetical protein KY394_07285 [Actinobacteria bacterium]|nr:hypothetical protein [Actinomycetota bacterium]
MSVVVKRSAVRMWLLAIAGIPLLVVSLDILTNRRITNWLRELVFTPENTQIYEPRDVIWAWAMALFAAFLVLWGLRELFVPTKLIESTDHGIWLRVGGPFRGAALVPWEEMTVIRAGHLEDEDDSRAEVLILAMTDPARIVDNPWGARWIAPGQLAILAEDWGQDATAVAQRLTDHALATAQSRTRERTARLGEES